jgi:hypothetical protein
MLFLFPNPVMWLGRRIVGSAVGAVGVGVTRGMAGVSVNAMIHPDDIRDLNRAFKQVDKALSKELGQVHKRIGEQVIDRLGGTSTGVGAGRGETIRPSAATDRIQLLVGGGHRADDPRKLQWGRVQKWPGGQAPRRPHIIGAARDIQDDIEQTYIREIEKIAEKAGFGTGSAIGRIFGDL